MTIIPSHYLANISPAAGLEGDCRVSLRISESGHDIEPIKQRYGKRIFNFEIVDDIYVNRELIGNLRGYRVRISATESVFDIGKLLDNFRKTIPVFWADIDYGSIAKINFLTAFGFQVHLDTVAAPSKGVLKEALDFYLHNPLLKTPVEPFHSLLKTVSAGSGYTLWDTEYENVKTNIYVGDDGRIALSERWHKAGRVYGKTDDSWEELTSSEIFNKLESFKKELFREKSDCIYCSHMDICGGYFKAIEKDFSCEEWIEVFDILRREAQSAREILEKHSGGEK